MISREGARYVRVGMRIAIAVSLIFIARFIFVGWCPAYLQSERLAVQMNVPLPGPAHTHSLCWRQFGLYAAPVLFVGIACELAFRSAQKHGAA
jgi:membrane protease YdiL (CAAX protease family)